MYESITDCLRVLRLEASGYSVTATELTDPENTPKNTLIRAVRNPRMSESERQASLDEYKRTVKFLLGDGADNYLDFLRK
jgi:hypothetical protein